jgi:hypothetical protein
MRHFNFDFASMVSRIRRVDFGRLLFHRKRRPPLEPVRASDDHTHVTTEWIDLDPPREKVWAMPAAGYHCRRRWILRYHSR